MYVEDEMCCRQYHDVIHFTTIDVYYIKIIFRVDLLTFKELESIMFVMKLAKMKTINLLVFDSFTLLNDRNKPDIFEKMEPRCPSIFIFVIFLHI